MMGPCLGIPKVSIMVYVGWNQETIVYGPTYWSFHNVSNSYKAGKESKQEPC